MKFNDSRTGFFLILLTFFILSVDVLFGAGYRWEIVGAGFLLCVQAALVIAWKRIAKRLRQSEARFVKIMDNLPVALTYADKNGNIIFNNERYRKVIGYSIEDTPTIHAWFEKAYPDEEIRKRKLDPWLDVLNEYERQMNGKTWGNTLCFTCRDGTTKDFDFTYFRDDEYLYAIFNEITDRLQAEKALRDSRETLSVAVELAHLGPWKYDLKTNMFGFGDEFYAIYGTDVAREGAFMAPDVYAREFVHPDDAWVVGAEVRRMLSFTERCYSTSLEHRIIRRDGAVRTIVVRINAIKDADGKTVTAYGANQDITEYKQFEKALRDSRETLSVAAELARLGPWKFNLDRNQYEFGDEFYAIYGTDVAREGAFMAPDVYIREFVHPDDVCMLEDCKSLSSTERHYSGRIEHRIIRRDGVVRIIAVQVNIVRDAGGKIVKWYGANQDITEHKQAEKALRKKTEEIQRLAYTDSLTGLPNRTHLIGRLEEEMEKVRRGESSGAVLFIDLDDFKTVNDAFGHTYGDVLIVMAGNRIVEQAGGGAFVGRIGGDEFMAVLPGENNRQYISNIVGGIIAALSQDTEVLGVRFHISASAGAAIYPDDGDTVEEIFKNADNAMYAAKKAGRNCWRFYEAIMQAEAYEKVLLTNSLHHAVERGELLLHYQPQVAVDSGAAAGFEALLRWNSPEHGSVSPVQFIPLAEQSGLIHAIGEWVLREACRFARRLADQGWGHVHVAVNVSPYQLCSDSFIDSVRDALNDFGVEPCRLELEITETALIVSLEESTRRLGELQGMGVQLTLDDFGTGYSSLTYLQHLPVNTLKIDKSFIDMIPVDGAHKAIIGNVVNMAHAMEMAVVAEGVETQEQFDFLARICCDCVQGYFFSWPVPEEEAVRFLSGYPQGVSFTRHFKGTGLLTARL